MPDATQEGQVSPEGHTYAASGPPVIGSLCPECQKKALEPGQAVCSPACRSARWRRQQGAGLDAIAARLRDGLLLLRDQVDDRLEEIEAVLARLRPRRGRKRRG